MSHPEILAARRLLRRGQHGALATLSHKLEGWPFATAVDYFADQRGRPVFLISALAEHARNMAMEPRVSLLVQHMEHDAQASPRLTVTGVAEPVSSGDAAALKGRYLRFFPAAEPYFSLDFFFCRIEPTQFRYVGGFGAARWIAPGDFLAPGTGWEEAESALIGTAWPAGTALLGIDCDGCDLLENHRHVRLDFPAPLDDPGGAAKALEKLLKARSR